MLEFGSILEALRDAGITPPEAAHPILSWCAALVCLFALATIGTLLLAATLMALRMVRVASSRLFEPVRPRKDSEQLLLLLRVLLGADKRR